MVKKFFKNNSFVLLGGLLVVILFCLRFYHLTILPIFADEAIYIRWAQVMRAEQTLRFLPLSDGKQPLYMWLVIPFLKFISDPLVAGRLMSIFAGLGTMVGVGFLGYLLFKNKVVSFATALIYAVSPFVFFFNRMALADSLLTMFGVWTFIFSLLAFRKGRLDYAMLAGFCLGGAWLTKSPALFFALMLPTLWLFAPWVKGLKNNSRVIIKTVFLSLVTVAIGFGFYNILRLGPNFHLVASRNMDYVWPIGHILSSPFDPLKPFLIASLQWIIAMGPWALIILGLFGVFVNWKKSWRQILVLGIWFLLPIGIQSEFAKNLTARYILFSIPYLIIIAASIFESKGGGMLKIIPFLFALFIFQALLFDRWLLVSPERANLPRSERSGYLEEWTAGQGIAETADFLIQEQAVNPEGKIVIGTEGYFGTLPDGLQIYLNSHPEITAIGVGLNFEEVPSSLINSKKAGDKTYLLVNGSRFGNTPTNLGLRLVKEFPKAQKPNGTHDSLLLMEVTDEAIVIKEISNKL